MKSYVWLCCDAPVNVITRMSIKTVPVCITFFYYRMVGVNRSPAHSTRSSGSLALRNRSVNHLTKKLLQQKKTALSKKKTDTKLLSTSTPSRPSRRECKTPPKPQSRSSNVNVTPSPVTKSSPVATRSQSSDSPRRQYRQMLKQVTAVDEQNIFGKSPSSRLKQIDKLKNASATGHSVMDDMLDLDAKKSVPKKTMTSPLASQGPVRKARVSTLTGTTGGSYATRRFIQLPTPSASKIVGKTVLVQPTLFSPSIAKKSKLSENLAVSICQVNSYLMLLF